MGKYKYYAIDAGGQKRIFPSWDECKAFRDNNPQNARYKGFASQQEAEAFLGLQGSGQVTMMQTQTEDSWERYRTPVQGIRAIAFTDGSYDAKREIYSYGVVLFDAGDETRQFQYNGKNELFKESRNVAGEIDGAIKATEKAIQFGYKELIIFHDYEGLGAWAEGRWKAEKPVAKNYVAKINQLRKDIQLIFCWIRGHTGIHYNELADRLAKEAIS